MNKHESLIIAITGLMICSMNFTVLSQAPPSFKYQAVVRDKTGQVLASQNISLQVIILQSTTKGPEVYREVHSVTTSELGLVNIEVGRGKSISGSMAAIDWAAGSHFLRIEMDPSGGTNFELMGVSELLSVPYALYAEKSGSGMREADLDWEVIGNDVVTGHGGSYPAGNVGIGNNVPGSLLYVAKNMGEPTITIRNLGGGGGATYSMVDDLSGADWKFKATTYGGFKIRDHANALDVIVLEPGSAANSIYIKSGGNVGIGTTNPVTKLDVNGGVKMNGSVVMTGITPGGSSDSLILALNPVTNQLYYKYASNLGGGGAGGGESNTASNLGTGIGVYEQKSGVDLQFNSLKSTNSILDIAEDDPDDVINFTLHQSHIDHNGLLNYLPQQHFYQKSIDTVALYHNGLLAATNGVLSDITNNSSDWNAAYGWGDHAAMGYLINEMDGDPANELQILVRVGNVVTLSPDGGAVSVDDADADPGNEIQNLAVSGDQLSISAGNTVVIQGDNWGSQTVITDATLTGDGTPANALHIAPQGAAPGQVLSWNGTTWIPSSAAFNGWSLTGNAGTNPDDNFIGTIDNQPLIFRVSGYHAGIIDPVYNLVALGPGALLANTTGDGNVAFGAYALYSNKANSRSTAVGALAMYYADDRTGGRPTYNTAVGYEALKGSSVATDNSGQFNTAVGDRALVSNTSGNYNAANGCHSLYNNASGSYNTASGSHSLYTNTSGNYNTASGNLSLHLNTSGDANTAIGEFSLFSNTTGDENTAMGGEALKSNVTGSGNVAIGMKALSQNQAGSCLVAVGDSALFTNLGNPGSGEGLCNTAVGSKTLYSNTTGNRNTAGGYQALYSNTISTNNTAYGYYALRSNTAGNNTAIGYEALSYNTTGEWNTACGYKALNDNLTGEDNCAFGGNSLEYNQTGSHNIAIGNRALRLNTTGHSNVAVGKDALHENTIRSNLVAIGDSALFNNGLGATDSDHAKRNTAIGSKALLSNTTGYRNTASGYQALWHNTSGYQNTALGNQTLVLNTTGHANTACGSYALCYNTTGNNNTASGNNALYSNTEGSENTANGLQALTENTTGDNNTACGSLALNFNTTGNNNTAVGAWALETNDEGSCNTALGNGALMFSYNSFCTGLGHNAGVSSSTISNSSVLGDAAIVNANAKIRIGDATMTVIEGQVDWSYPSDGRFKSNVREEVKGLDFILKLRPVVYNFDTWKYTEFLTRNMPSDKQEEYLNAKDFSESTAIRHSGFVAQEVVEAARAVGYDFNGVHIPVNGEDNYSIAPGQFVAPLVKAIQEQQAMIEEQRAMIQALHQRVASLEAERGE